MLNYPMAPEYNQQNKLRYVNPSNMGFVQRISLQFNGIIRGFGILPLKLESPPVRP